MFAETCRCVNLVRLVLFTCGMVGVFLLETMNREVSSILYMVPVQFFGYV